jgi:hypothetical protein
VTLGEIQRGIEITRARDSAKAREIEAWADKLERTFAVVPADAAIFRRHARMMRARPEALYEDALIAATASVLDISVVTRNVADFQGFEIAVVDPFRGPQGVPR